MNLSKREKRLLTVLRIRGTEGYRCATQPEHDGDVIAGAIWFALGIYWRPSEWELELKGNRSLQQSYSHTFRRLREKGLVGQHDEPQQVFGLSLDPASYYYFIGEGSDIAESLPTPRDLARTCAYKRCNRWLPPTHDGPACSRCRFSRQNRESSAYKRTQRGEGFNEFVRSGLADVTNEGLISHDHAADAMKVAWSMYRAGTPLLDDWRESFKGETFPTATRPLYGTLEEATTA